MSLDPKRCSFVFSISLPFKERVIVFQEKLTEQLVQYFNKQLTISLLFRFIFQRHFPVGILDFYRKEYDKYWRAIQFPSGVFNQYK